VKTSGELKYDDEIFDNSATLKCGTHKAMACVFSNQVRNDNLGRACDS
jgi:hypothetical protein